MSRPAPDGSRPGVERRVAEGRHAGGRSQSLAWLHARVRSAPRLLAQAPPWARRAFDHDWAPVEALLAQARMLPEQLYEFLLSCNSGYVLISPGESSYLPGSAEVRGRAVQNVALISIEDLAAANDRPLHVLGHLIDHHLGCGGETDGLWLSEGGGVDPRWQEAGVRLSALYALGYGVDDVALSGMRDYFAQSLAVYCHDRRRLNVADPQIEKWLRNTIFNDQFWGVED